jgi:hypothetical protein
MKKLFILFAVLFFGIKSASAKLGIVNNTSCAISFCIFCHDAANSTCGYYQSLGFTVAANSTTVFYTASDVGACYFYPYYVDFAYPGEGIAYDYVKFWTDAGYSNLGSVGLGSCAAGTSWTGSSNWCGGGPLNAVITNFGPHQTVTFTN